MINNVASVLKALGEPTRLRIVRLLKERELCTCEMVFILDVSQPRISQHMKILKQTGIIKERHEGTRSFYSLETNLNHGSVLCLEQLFATDLAEIAELHKACETLENLDGNSKIIRHGKLPDSVTV